MPKELELPPNYKALLTDAYRHGLEVRCEQLQEHLDAVPRWRWLRRFHLERQLLLTVFASECYRIGFEKLAKPWA